jgi:hypothetical protein
MATTLLELVQQASAEMGLAVPNAVVGNTAADVTQLYYLINAAGNEIAREYPWEALNVEYDWYSQYSESDGAIINGTSVITGVDPATVAFINAAGAGNFQVQGEGVIQSTQVVSATGTTVTINSAATSDGSGNYVFGQVMYDLPTGFDRITDRTQYDKSKRWEMLGPETPQQWQWLKSSYISTGPRIRWRIMGQKFQIWPLTSTNEYLSFEYISTNWATSATGTTQLQFLADTDTCIYPNRLMVLALKKKYFEIKGFDTSSFQRDYDMQLNIAKANDAGSATLSLAPRTANVLIGWENIPDANYGA